ncbi:MAG: hypothetical protein ACI97A_003957 [Planctomycetota bacterium]|jgi:hypothetical protein
MAKRKITQRELNRATLGRQMLLERKQMTPLKAIEKLCGLQAQGPRPPQIGLWTRLKNFDSQNLHRQLMTRKIVRATMMRGTIHLVSASDYLQFRPCIQPVLTKGMQGVLGKRVANLDPETIVGPARKLFLAQDRNFKDLLAELSPKLSKFDASTLRYVVRMNLPLVQVPKDVPWSYAANAEFTLAEDWLQEDVDMERDEAPLLFRRYLAAFGPASISDFRIWSGLKGCAEVSDAEHGKLTIFEDEDGRVLYDLPRAPRPDAKTPVPIRFLPDYDNLILAFDDRRRVVPNAFRSRLCTKNLRILPTFLVDGLVAGTWDFGSSKKIAELAIQPFVKLNKKTTRDLLAEGEALLGFVFPNLELGGVRLNKPTD